MKRTATTLAALFAALSAFAQHDGYVTGSIESNSIQYAKDEATGAVLPEDRFGSNNYAKVDAFWGNFSAGFQIEGYMPVLQGFSPYLEGIALTSKYAAYNADGWSVRLGNFYGQFGSGLLFRSWEDRDLGFNNSLEGIDIAYNWNGAVSVRAICGRPRFGMEVKDVWVRGADANLSVAQLLGMQAFDIDLGASYVDRYEEGGWSPDARLNVGGYSARAGLGWNGLSLKGEYVTRASNETSEDAQGAQAILAELGYSGHGLGITATFRKMSNMVFGMSRDSADGMYEIINYTPALSQQYTYTLTTLNPYSSHPINEIGGQVDVSYNFRRGTLLGGKRGMKIHANYSQWHGPSNAYTGEGDSILYFRDASIDIDKSFSSKLKLKALYSFQSYNPALKAPNHLGEEMWNSHIVVFDILYKFDKKQSLRTEIQHLATKKNIIEGDSYNRFRSNWLSGLLEYNIAPAWSIYIQDSWNYGNDEQRLHYYNGGFSYSRSNVRADLSYGRYMEGYICSGGVCRTIPAYTGANLKFTFIF